MLYTNFNIYPFTILLKQALNSLLFKEDNDNKILLVNIKHIKLYYKCDLKLYRIYTLFLSIYKRIEIYVYHKVDKLTHCWKIASVEIII